MGPVSNRTRSRPEPIERVGHAAGNPLRRRTAVAAGSPRSAHFLACWPRETASSLHAGPDCCFWTGRGSLPELESTVYVAITTHCLGGRP